MTIPALFLDAWARHTLARFDAACAEPVRSQFRVLRNLLHRARATEWGRRFRFEEIRDVESFRRRVPVTPYEQAAPDWHRAFAGERDIAWPGHIRFFAMSSGTTAGNKYIPVSPDAIRANRRAGSLLFAHLVRVLGPAALTAGKFFYLGGSTSLKPRGQCFTGDASGIATRHTPWYARRRLLPDPEIAAIVDWEEKIRAIVQRYPEHDVRVLSACPSWAAVLFRELEARTGRSPRQVWPGLRVFVSFGMAFEPYRNTFRQALGPALQIIDTYSSSEAGMTGIQEEDRGPLRLLVDNGVFYEFIPAESAMDDNPPRLHIGEVQPGKDYALLLSTNAGIWAYPLGDLVRFETLAPPRIRFAGRARISLSAFGEHVTLEMIENAVAQACRKTGAIVADYTVVPKYPGPDNPVPRHRWIFEFEHPPGDPAEFIRIVDAAIRQASEDYDTHRTGDFGLAPPEIVRVPPRTFYAWMKQRGHLGGQHKVPRVLDDPRAAAWLEARILEEPFPPATG